MDNEDIILLGQALGLRRSNLKRMDSLPADMIDAWLLKSDYVLETTGDPTWKSLYDSLKLINQNGIAAEIQREGIVECGIQ